MKKKLKIEQLKVQSFVTSAQAGKVFGGETKIPCNIPNPFTDFSCYANISCNPVACNLYSYADPCVFGPDTIAVTGDCPAVTVRNMC